MQCNVAADGGIRGGGAVKGLLGVAAGFALTMASPVAGLVALPLAVGFTAYANKKAKQYGAEVEALDRISRENKR